MNYLNDINNQAINGNITNTTTNYQNKDFFPGCCPFDIVTQIEYPTNDYISFIV